MHPIYQMDFYSAVRDGPFQEFLGILYSTYVEMQDLSV